MFLLRSPHTSRTSLSAVYVGIFFLSLHYALTVYIDSTFLAKSVGEKGVGLVFVIGYLLSIFALFFAPKLLRSLGNYLTTVLLSLCEIFLLLALPFFQSALLIATLFIIHTSLVTFLLFNFDIFTESRSKNSTTGFTRGVYNTMLNTAVVLGPVLAGFILSTATMGSSGDFWKIYFASAFFMLPVLAILFLSLQDFSDPHYHDLDWRETLRKMWRDDDIFLITVANFLLQFFYAIMVIYMPVYLSTHIGFSWSDIGIIFGIMLLPFIFFELPLGRLADEKLGEKEILTAGFVLVSITTFSLSFLTTANIALWAAILFMTRVGAAAIEIMTETYFFKKISGSDAALVSMFRYTKPLAYIIAPLFVSLFLVIIPLQNFFLILGFLIFISIPVVLAIDDTK